MSFINNHLDLLPKISTETIEYPVGWKEKICTFLDLKKNGISFNERLMNSRAFKNPNIYIKVVEFLKLDEKGSNDPNPLFGSHKPDFPNDAYYDVRSRMQMERSSAPTDSFLSSKANAPQPSSSKKSHSILSESIFDAKVTNEKRIKR